MKKRTIKEQITQGLLNLIKVKSIATFVSLGLFVYTVTNNVLDSATTTAILMLVFQNLFGKGKEV